MGARLALALLAVVVAQLALSSSAAASSYSITAGGPPVTVATTVADEKATAAFAGAAGMRVSLQMTDVTIGSSTCCSTKVSILRPDGKALVSGASVGTSGGFIDTKTLPATGTYSIVVDPQKSATGSMTLTLHDVPPDDTDTVVPGGAAVTVGTAVPGQNAAVTFAGTSGQRVSLLVDPACCTAQIVILRPNGSRLTSAFFGTAGGFIDTQTLPQSGTYTIAVDPQSVATGDVTLTLHDVPPDAAGTITAGGPEVVATTTVPGQNARLTFEGTKDGRISLEVGPACCVTRVSILDPFGNTVVAPTFIGPFGGFVDTRTLAATGTYTIAIDPQNAAVGSRTFTLFDVPPDATGSIAPGGPDATIATTVPGQNAKLAFAGTADRRISLELGPTCCALSVSILNPDGSVLVPAKSMSVAGGFLDPVRLPATGTYTLLLDPQGTATGSVRLRLHDVPADVTATIVAGGPEATVTTTVPGQNASLTFSGTAGRRVSLEVGPTCCSTSISILRPDGSVLVAPTFVGTFGGFVDARTLPETGSYTIVVDLQSSAVGAVTLALHDVPPDGTATLTVGGAPVTIAIAAPGQNAGLTFAGTAGQRVGLELRPTCCSARVSIVSPDGSTLVPSTFVGTTGAVVDSRPLPVTGTYTIVVDPQGAATGDMTFSLYDVPPDASGTITPGGPPVTVTTTTPGQNAAVTFTGTAGQRVSLRVATQCCLTKVSIVTPDASALVAPATFATGGGFVDTQTLPASGTYTVVIDPQDSATGEYTLTLYDVPPDATGSVAIDGPNATVTTTVPGQNAKLTFAGGAFDGIKVTTGPFNCCHVRISLLDPLGATRAGPTAFNPDGGALYARLPTSGTYTIVIDPTGPNVGDVHVAVELDNTAPAVPVLALSESSPDSHVAGDTLFYRPTGSGGTFTVSATTSDGDTGVQKVEFPGLLGGFSPTAVTTDPTAPFVQTYAWTTGATYDWTPNLVTAYDRVGNSSAAAFAVSRDADPPTTADNTATIGSAWKRTDQLVTLTPTDARSGVAATYATVDGSTPTTASAQGTSVAVAAEGSFTVKYFSVDNVGNVEGVRVADTQVRIDKTRPSAAALDPLPAAIRTGQSLTGSGSDALSEVASISYYYCAGGNCTPSLLIGSSSAGPTYSVVWGSQPPDGTYQVLARVWDAAGNSLDSVKRTVTIDNTAPATTITRTPANPTNQTGATFEFASNESGSTFQCRLDAGPWTACTSPKGYTGLAAGSHTFEVAATDPVGNADGTPASYAWTIDLTPPETTITASPPPATSQTSASLSFVSTESGSTFLCSLDASPYAACTSPTSYTGLAQGSHTFAVRAVDPAGNSDGTAATHTWTIDTAAPETTITSAPAGPTTGTSASFTFTSTEAGSTFQCSLDDSAYAACTSPTSYTGLAAGSHTVRVRAIDAVGNVDATPATHTWTIDTTAPETTITSAPASPTNGTAASFAFTSSESGSTFECSLDGSAYAACTSPTSYTGLSAGSHAFAVKATDAAGNTDATPATHTWIVDLAAPDTTITSGPATPTNGTSASFTFTSSESGSTFECSLDGSAYAACTSPTSYTGLAAGSHAFAVKATDAAGNTDATPAAWTWTVDTAVPQTAITSAPPAATTSATATFEFGASEPGSTFECRLDDGGWVACGSPTTYTELAAGNHAFDVRATDPAGNTDATPASHTWTIDVSAPVTAIGTGPDDPTNQTTASFGFTSSEPGSTFECSLDGAPLLSCSSPTVYSGLAAGTHVFEVRATDPAGNTDATPASHSWTVDLDAPETAIGSGPADPTNEASATFAFAANEAGSSFQCRLDAGAWTACTSPRSYTGLSAGRHAFDVRATDPAGNTDATPASWAWTVDTSAPETAITSAPVDPTKETTATFGLAASEPGSTFECQLDAGGYVPCTSPTTYAGVGAGSHLFHVRATDPAGNVDATPATYSWVVDVTSPDTTVTSGPDDPTNRTDATFGLSASELSSTFECSLDGAPFAPCTTPAAYAGLSAGAHRLEVRATDPAGNTDPTPATYTWTIDVVAPAAPTIDSPADGAVRSSGDFTVSGTAEPGSSVELFDGPTSVGTATAGAAGAWSKSLTGVAEGSHSYTARATDAAGNTSVASSAVAVTVDLTPPNTRIDTGPTGSTSSTTATFAFSADGAAAGFECSLDGAAFAGCASPRFYSGLAEGAHTFQVRAVDAAGNRDPTPASRSWRVDVTAPAAPVITSPADGSTSASAGVTLAGSAEAGSIVEVFDGAASRGVTVADATGAWSKPLAGVADGPHTYTATATDTASNTSPASSPVTVTVDTTAPETTITSGPADTTSATEATFAFSADDAAAGFECSLDGAAFAGCTSPAAYAGLAAGTHVFRVRALDRAGNADPTPAAHTWTIT